MAWQPLPQKNKLKSLKVAKWRINDEWKFQGVGGFDLWRTDGQTNKQTNEQTNGWTDICDCRVTFATENRIFTDNCQIKFYHPPSYPFLTTLAPTQPIELMKWIEIFFKLLGPSTLLPPFWPMSVNILFFGGCHPLVVAKVLSQMKSTLCSMIFVIFTLCPQKNLEVFFSISQLLLGQIQKVRSVLKTAGSENFKTVFSFDIWPSRSWDIWG